MKEIKGVSAKNVHRPHVSDGVKFNDA